MTQLHDDEIEAEILQAEDDSHLLVLVPWYAEPEIIDEGLTQAARLGYSDITSEGHMPGYESKGCSDWDYFRMEPPRA
jgi:hypothetical protein